MPEQVVEGQALRTLGERSQYLKEDLMEEMGDEEAILSYKAMRNSQRYYI